MKKSKKLKKLGFVFSQTIDDCDYYIKDADYKYSIELKICDDIITVTNVYENNQRFDVFIGFCKSYKMFKCIYKILNVEDKISDILAKRFLKMIKKF